MASTRWWFTAAILIGGVASPALGQTDPPSTSPLRDAIARETARLGAQTKAPEVTARWSRVRSLPSGERIHVGLSGQAALLRSFLAADDTTLTVLNDANPMLPEQAVRDLRRLAATDPRSLLILTRGGTLRLDRLRIDSQGVFLDDTRIADVSSIVELHSRDEVSEIVLADRRAPKRFWRHLLGWPGLIGVGVGVGLSAHACETRKPCAVSDRTVALSGAAGAFGMAFAARLDDRRTPDGIVYRRLP